MKRFWLLLLLICFHAASAQAAGAFVQGIVCSNASPTHTCTLTGTTAGNLLAVGIEYTWSGSIPSATVADSHGSCSLGVGPTEETSTPFQDYIFYCSNIAGGSDTITVTYSQSFIFNRIVIGEFSGLATSLPLDGTGSGTAYTSGGNSSGTWTATNGDWVVGFGFNISGTITTGAGFSSNASVTSGGIRMEWQTLSGTSASVSFTGNAGSPSVVQGVTFLIAPAATNPASVIFKGVQF